MIIAGVASGMSFAIARGMPMGGGKGLEQIPFELPLRDCALG